MMIEAMADQLGLPPTYIVNLSKGASHEYKAFDIAKRTGGVRTIHHPSRRLKALQRWLLLRVIEQLPVHQSATAYRKGKSILDNAKVHAASRYLLRMDFESFFPSITESDLRKYIGDHLDRFAKWTVNDKDVFCNLVCRFKSLTIGAPTSPALSNAICHDLDVALQALSEQKGIAYSRYADDLFFSADQPNVLKEVQKDLARLVAKLKIPASLKINKAKTRHSSRKGSRRVTGITLGSDGNTYIGRKLKRKIRSLVYRQDTLDNASRASLAGMIAYASGFDPDFLNSLIAKYGLSVVSKAMNSRP